MRLLDQLYKISEDTPVWVSEDASSAEGIYLGPVGEMKLHDAKGYEVVEIYPERYPAIGSLGISIIVKKERGNE